MHIATLRVSNFRRLKDVLVDLESETTIFVGANNSGKTSATHVFKLFLGSDNARGKFAIHDFSADCWGDLDAIGEGENAQNSTLPAIHLDLWLSVEDHNAYRVIDLLPDLNWAGTPIGIRCRYSAKDPDALLENYKIARRQAAARMREDSAYKPWPESLTDYLSKRLRDEYQIEYLGLDFGKTDHEYRFSPSYGGFQLSGSRAASARIVDQLIRVDFLEAQRYLSDSESRGRAEDLSKRLSRYYARNLKKPEQDFDALGVIAQSEAGINAHFADEFAALLSTISDMSYPGVANAKLVIKASLNAESILSGNARVHYALPGLEGQNMTLPDQYNGLGFKNLIYMVVEVLDFDAGWKAEDNDRAPIHIVMIEEPESHLHAQLQQVFTRKIRDLIQPETDYQTQMIVTTHSAHVIYESDFTPIRYFKRTSPADSSPYTNVRNLSTFYRGEKQATQNFLLQYFRLTHCDLFFADGAVLVEGNVERLLVPLMINRVAKKLEASHLTLLEVGGAFAHVFESLIEFLGLPTLVITDLDSVEGAVHEHTESSGEASESDFDEDESGRVASRKACVVNTPGAVTSNMTLQKWAPGLSSVADLLQATDVAKMPLGDAGVLHVRVAYQTLTPCSWRGETALAAGRTLEEAFALQNLAWCQEADNKNLGLRLRRPEELNLMDVRQKLFERVRNFDKTKFALALIAKDRAGWTVPIYIAEGLKWLENELSVDTTQPLSDSEVLVPSPRPEAAPR